MAAKTIVDLSLSSDGEDNFHDYKPSANTCDSVAEANEVFVEISDESAEENHPKRRKLSRLNDTSDAHVTSSNHKVAVSQFPVSKSISHPTKIRGEKQTLNVSDEIVFTSSADNVQDTRRILDERHIHLQNDNPDVDLPEDPFSTRQATIGPAVSNRTAALIANLRESRPCNKQPGVKKSSKTREASYHRSKSPQDGRHRIVDEIDDEDPARLVRRPSRKPKLTEEEKATKARERGEAKAARLVQRANEKEEEKERRRIEREEKAREKQRNADLAEVNRVKKDKKETSKEMIVDLPMSLEGSRQDDQIKEYTRNLGIETNIYQSPFADTIRWRRNVDSYFDEDKGYRVSMPREIRVESHILCLLPVKAFVELATAEPAQAENDTIDQHVLKLKTNYPGCTVVYLIEGLNAWMKKNKSIRNRDFQSPILAQVDMTNPEGTSAGRQPSKRKRAKERYIDEDLLEDALLRLQVSHGCLIHNTATPFETASWVVNFTQHISLIPYRHVTG